MNSENSIFYHLSNLLESINFDIFHQQEPAIPNCQKLEDEVKSLITHMLQALEETSISKEYLSEILRLGMQRLSKIDIADPAVKDHAASYLKKIVDLLDLDDEFRIALYLWPNQNGE